MEKKNEFKLSTLRQFGAENISFTATVYSDKMTLTPEEIDSQISQISEVLNKAFAAVQEREIAEKGVLAESSARRTEAVKRLDDALKEEMVAKKHAQETMKAAERLSNKLSKNK